MFLVARRFAAHHQAQIAGRLCRSEVKQEETVQWKSEAHAFLLACKQQDFVEGGALGCNCRKRSTACPLSTSHTPAIGSSKSLTSQDTSSSQVRRR